MTPVGRGLPSVLSEITHEKLVFNPDENFAPWNIFSGNGSLFRLRWSYWTAYSKKDILCLSHNKDHMAVCPALQKTKFWKINTYKSIEWELSRYIAGNNTVATCMLRTGIWRVKAKLFSSRALAFCYLLPNTSTKWEVWSQNATRILTFRAVKSYYSWLGYYNLRFYTLHKSKSITDL